MVVLGLAGAATAQGVDAFIGFGTLMAPTNPGSSTYLGGGTGAVPYGPMGGGLYPDLGADVLFWRGGELGIGGEVSWRGSQNQNDPNYGPYRPLFYDFNAVYKPITSGTLQPEIQVGFGALSTRFYTNSFTSCGYSGYGGCSNYLSFSHIAAHFAVGLRYYFRGHLFIRPELHYYAIHNNREFGVGHAYRAAISLGYSLSPS
jgi:hypothetical protein